MTISETAVQPAAGSHPYPDPSVLPVDFYKDTAVRYERIGAKADANIARWYAQARKKVLDPEPEEAPDPLPRRSHAATAVTQPDPVPVPCVPAPQSLPEPESGPPLTGRQRRLFGRPKPAAPVRDQPPAVTEPAWQEPKRAGRHRAPEAPDSAKGTAAPPVAPEQDADTILPGAIEPVPAIGALDIESEQHMTEFLGAHDDFPAKPDEWTDAAKQMTSALERPVNTGEQE